MKEIEFSTMFDLNSSPGMGGDFFDAFTARHRIKIKPHHMHWSNSWNELVQYGLSSQGPDVSEVGSTWLGSFHAMEALRPLTAGEMALLASEQNYPPALWHACQNHQNNLMLGIPFALDVRVVLYRRDWLQKAGVDESTAFVDSARFSETLRQIKATGHPSPLGLITFESDTRLIHDLACWIWSADGNIRSDDGHRMMLMDPKSRAGMEAYFGLNEFISPEMYRLPEYQVLRNFFAGKTAVAISPVQSYLEVIMNKSNVNPEVVDNIGLAMLMQVPYTGGSALAIWRHSSDYQDSLKLVQYMTCIEAWQALNKQYMPYAPARLDILEQSPLGAIPFYPAIQKSLQNGRGFHSGHRWNGVEARLVTVIQQMWDDIRLNPEINIAREVEQRFSTLCNRLEQTILASSW